MKDKYATVEQLIDQKAGGVADAKKRAQALQQEAKELLLKAGDKLRLLKGKRHSPVDLQSVRFLSPLLNNCVPQTWRSPTPTTSGLWS